MGCAVATRYHTMTEIAGELSVPRHRVVHAITSRGIRHAAEIGEQRGYDEQAVAAVRRYLESVDAKR